MDSLVNTSRFSGITAKLSANQHGLQESTNNATPGIVWHFDASRVVNPYTGDGGLLKGQFASTLDGSFNSFCGISNARNNHRPQWSVAMGGADSPFVVSESAFLPGVYKIGQQGSGNNPLHLSNLGLTYISPGLTQESANNDITNSPYMLCYLVVEVPASENGAYDISVLDGTSGVSGASGPAFCYGNVIDTGIYGVSIDPHGRLTKIKGTAGNELTLSGGAWPVAQRPTAADAGDAGIYAFVLALSSNAAPASAKAGSAKYVNGTVSLYSGVAMSVTGVPPATTIRGGNDAGAPTKSFAVNAGGDCYAGWGLIMGGFHAYTAAIPDGEITRVAERLVKGKLPYWWSD